MKGLLHIAAAFFGNALALWLAGQYIPQFLTPPDSISVSTNLVDLAIAAGVLTAINLILRPILKVVLSPVILITLGLAVIAINAFTIYLMTYLVPIVASGHQIVSITGLLPLLYVTILTTVVNFITRKII